MRWSAVALVASLLLASAPASSADDAGRLKLAREVVETAHAADNLRIIFPTMMNQMRGLLVQQHAGNAKDIDVYLQRFQSKFESGIPSFVDLVAEV